MGGHSLLQGIFPSQGLNPCLSHCRRILYCLSHQRSPRIPEWVACPFSNGSSWSRNQTGISCIAAGFFTIELPGNNIILCFKRMPACCILNRLWGRDGQRWKWAVSLKFTQVSNSAVVQVRGDGGLLHSDCSGEGGEKWSDSWYILNVKTTEFLTEWPWCVKGRSESRMTLRALAWTLGFPGGTVVKNLPASAGDTGDLGLIPGSRRSPGVGNDNPLQYSCLGNPMDRGGWWTTVYRVAKSQTWLSMHAAPTGRIKLKWERLWGRTGLWGKIRNTVWYMLSLICYKMSKWRYWLSNGYKSEVQERNLGWSYKIRSCQPANVV